MKRLCNATLRHMDEEGTQLPDYDRRGLRPRIVHLGMGNFHRAHQACFTEDALNRGAERDWGISGISLRRSAMRDLLRPQDFLYTLEVRDNEKRNRRVIGSVIDVWVGPEDPDTAIQRIAGADVISLTVTEKAYGLDAQGDLDPRHPDVAFDLASASDAPRSVVGYLARALGARRTGTGAPVTIISCDNMTDNGRRLESAVKCFLNETDTATLDWMAANTAFPCTMVDRIVPATTPEFVVEVSDAMGVEDLAPVVTEPFIQWVIEDRFASSIPDWAGSGAVIVADVSPFEAAKLRMLNGSHSTLAYLGSLAGMETVADAIADPSMHSLLDRMMRVEIQPTLSVPQSLDLDDYRERLLERFSNRAMHHRLHQIAMDGSQKLPPRLLGTIRDALEQGSPIHCLSLAVAGWIRYLRGHTFDGEAYDIDDPLAGDLGTWLSESGGEVSEFMRACGLFGEDLPAQIAFTRLVQQWVDAMESSTPQEVVGRAIA